MPQPPPQPAPTGFHTRAMTPVQNPTYVYNDDSSFKQTPPARNVLELPPGVPAGTDPRTTVQGTRPPVAGLTPIVPYAGQTPWNVWGLQPA
jgi:hypothetical protein